MARRDRDFDYDDPLVGPGRWKRWLLRLGLLVAAIVALYFITSSDVFLRRIVLPRLVNSLNGQVTVGSISLAPFSRLQVTDLEVRLPEGQTVLAAKEAEIRYGLASFLRGRWILPEIRLISPELNIIRAADGITSLDRLLVSETPRRPLVFQPPKELLIGRLSMENATFSYEHQLSNGERTRVAGRQVQLSLANLGHGREATMEAQGRIGMEKLREGGGGRLIMGFGLSSTSSLGRNLRPSSIKTDIRLETQEATGDYASLAGLIGQFDGQMANKEVRQCLLRFEKEGAALGSLQIRGPVDFDKMDMRLRAQLTGLSHEVLDLVGSPFGMSFGEARLDGDLVVNMGGGDSIVITSTLDGKGLGLRTPAGATPTLDVAFRLNGRMQLSSKTADISKLSLTAREGDRELFHLNAPRSINLLWNLTVRPSINESSVDFRLNALDLSRWRPLLGPGFPTGVVTVEGVMTNRDDGRRLRAWVTNRIEKLAFTAGPYSVSNATARVTTKLELRDYFSIAAEETLVDAVIDGVPLLTGRGSGSYELRNKEVRMQFDLRGSASNIVARFPHPLVEAGGGDVRFDGSAQLRGGSRVVGVSLVLDGFEGRLDRYAFDGEYIRADCSLDWTSEQLFLRQLGVSVGRGAGRAGSVYVNGRISPAGEARFDLTAVNLGSASLTPFLRPYLSPITLAGGTIDGQGQVRVTSGGRRDIDFNLSTKDLVFRDGTSGLNHVPLTVKPWLVSLSQTGRRFEIHTNSIALPPTERATNVLSATGFLDFSAAGGEPGEVSIRSAGLDLTDVASFYRTNQPTRLGDSSSSLPSGLLTSGLVGLGLPIPDFVANLDVRRLFVADLEAINCLAQATSTNGLLRLDSLSAEVGAGRLRARAQVPVRESAGNRILQVAFERFPVSPLATALVGASRGRYTGDVSAELDYTAPGTRGPTAAPAEGRLSLTMTNLVFRVLPEWTRRTLGPVAAAFKMEEILRSPMRYLGGRAQLSGDVVTLQDWTAISDLFVMEMAGEARLGPTWAESAFALPVSLSLREALAQRVPVTDLQPASQPGYLRLPSFLSVEGSPAEWSPKLKTDDPRLRPFLAGALDPATERSTDPAVVSPEGGASP